MSYAAQARVPTASAARYVAQVCKHWSHNLAVEHDGDVGRITFPRHARAASATSPASPVRFPA